MPLETDVKTKTAVTPERLRASADYFLSQIEDPAKEKLRYFFLRKSHGIFLFLFLTTWILGGVALGFQISRKSLPPLTIWQWSHSEKSDMDFSYVCPNKTDDDFDKSLHQVRKGEYILKPSSEEVACYSAYLKLHGQHKITAMGLVSSILSFEFLIKFLFFGFSLACYLVIIRAFKFLRGNDVSRLALACFFVFIEICWGALMEMPKFQYLREHLPMMIFEIMPLVIIPALMTNLFNGRLAICTSLFHTFVYILFCNIPDPNHDLMCFSLMISMSSLFIFRRINTREGFFSSGIIFSLFLIVIGCLARLSRGALKLDWEEISRMLLSAFSIGIITAIFCILVLPVIESLFKLPSDIMLNNLNTVNTPLLQRLRREAPGTYAHSGAVADLATNAAIAIGADAKLVNVMSLYHDIGKLYAPQYFAENQQGRVNPHDSLNPNESAMVIREHVVFGQEIAKKYHLSKLVLPAIAQHHGDSLISFFYRKASLLAQQNNTAAPEESDYRYSGPKPLSREIAIISLADACEAAVRALRSTSRSVLPAAPSQKEGHPSEYMDEIRKIEQRLNDVITGRVKEGQLEECDLTTQELGIIRRSFLETIINKEHVRPEYMK